MKQFLLLSTPIILAQFIPIDIVCIYSIRPLFAANRAATISSTGANYSCSDWVKSYKGKPKIGIKHSLKMACGPIVITKEFTPRPCSLNDKYLGPKSDQIACSLTNTKSIYKFFIKDKSGVKHRVSPSESTSYPVCNNNFRQEVKDTTYSFSNSSITVTVREDLTYKGKRTPAVPKPDL